MQNAECRMRSKAVLHSALCILHSAFVALLVGCSAVPATNHDDRAMNRAAEEYVRLVLAVGEHDADYVDAYYGPPEWRARAGKAQGPPTQLAAAAPALARDLAEAAPPSSRQDAAEDGSEEDELIPLRHQYLSRQLEAVRTRLQMLSGRKLS